MKKISLIGILALIAAASYYFLPQEEDPSSKKSKIMTTSSSKKLFLGARTKSVAASQVQDSAVQDSCSDLSSQLDTIDFNVSVKEWIEGIKAAEVDNCKDPLVLDQLTNLKQNCFEKFHEGMCAQNAVFLRAVLRTRNIPDGEDRELLADLILKEFSTNNPDFKKLAKFAEKLMDMDPDQKAYQKLWASSKIISQLGPNSNPMDVADAVSKRVGEEIFNEPDMQGLKLAMATGFNPTSVEEYARGYLSKNDTSGMHEILGWSLWKQNRFAEAINELERAIDMNPKDKWLQEQLQKVKSKGANPDSYQARIQLGFNYNDLYN